MKNGRAYWLFIVLALVLPASGQVSVSIGIAPPPIPYEAPPPPPPAPEMVWVAGFWAPQGHHYHWVAGRYEQPPYPGASWSHPHYDRYSDGWHYDEGHWDREDHEHGHGHAYGHDRDGNEGHEHGHGHD